MFSKKTDKNPRWTIRKNKIHFGTYKSTPKTMDISGILGPFTGLPLPAFLTNTRIKSTLSFAFNLDNFIGVVEYFDGKFIGTAEMIFWDKKTGQKYSYHTIMGPRRRFVPVSTREAVCASYRPSRFIKLFWSKRINRISLNCSLGGDHYRLSAKCVIHADYEQKRQHQFFAVCPAPVNRRCSADWIVPLTVTGGLSLSKHRRNIKWVEETPGFAMMMMNRVYAPVRTVSETAYAMASINGKNVCFHFSNASYDSLDNDSYNSNVLFVDNQMTLLPSVVISHTFGINNSWVIQDTESMVDLVFTPKSREDHTSSILFVKNRYSILFGTFEGTLLTEDGSKIEIKNCPGIVKKNLLRS